jgi:cytochrome P450
MAMQFVQLHVLSEDGLVMLLLDLFSAGVESIANTLDYAMLYMVLNPHIQRKVQEELDAVVERSRRTTDDDRPLYDKTVFIQKLQYITQFK